MGELIPGYDGRAALDGIHAMAVSKLREAGWVRVDEVVAFLRQLDGVEAALAGQWAFEEAARRIEEQFRPASRLPFRLVVDERLPPDAVVVVGTPKDVSDEPDPARRWDGRVAVLRVDPPAED